MTPAGMIVMKALEDEIYRAFSEANLDSGKPYEICLLQFFSKVVVPYVFLGKIPFQRR